MAASDRADAPAGSEVVGPVLALLATGRFDALREAFAPPLRPLVLPSALAEAWAAVTGDDPGPVSLGAVEVGGSTGGPSTYRAVVRIGARTAGLVVDATPDGLLTALLLRPGPPPAVVAWTPPAYADPARFTETDVELAPEPARATPGTLTVPGTPGRRPAVLLLGGSGPTDRDGTVGPVRFLQDLAWGLASRGVAVLRFDKITFSHPEALRHAVSPTLADEYLQHADRALALLRAHPRVDGRRLVVAGHSLGGTVAPLVASAHPDVAGLVVLAGAALPVHHTLVRQVRGDDASDPDDPQLAELLVQVARVDALTAQDATPPSLLPLGLPASYWRDLRDLDGPGLAARLPQPVLLLQGEADRQTTVEGDLAAWRRALGGRADVTVRIVPGVDHLFVRVPDGDEETPIGSRDSEPVTPHVDVAVVDACTTWLASTFGDA